MENSSILTATTTGGPNQLPISVTQQHQYPAHHPTLAHDIPTTQPALGQLVVPIAENEQDHSTTIEFESPDSHNEQPVMKTTLTIQHSDHDSSNLTERGETSAVQSIDLRLTENVLSDIENQIESTTTSMGNPENDSSNHPQTATLIATTPHTALLHDYSNPKIATYFVRVYPTFIALLSLKFLAEKYSPYDTRIPFMIISIVAYLMALLDLVILFCVYDRLKRPSNQHLSPGHYKILTYVFHILWILAILSVVSLLFTPQR